MNIPNIYTQVQLNLLTFKLHKKRLLINPEVKCCMDIEKQGQEGRHNARKAGFLKQVQASRLLETTYTSFQG